jgi:hypothetical protein
LRRATATAPRLLLAIVSGRGDAAWGRFCPDLAAEVAARVPGVVDVVDEMTWPWLSLLGHRCLLA